MAELRKYGIATTIIFPLVSFTSTRADFSTSITFAAGDARITKDESTLENCNSTAVHILAGLYRLALSSTETNAARIGILIIDSTTKVWEDQAILIETYGSTLGQHSVDIDSSDGRMVSQVAGLNIGVITSTSIAADALLSTGFGTGALTARVIAADAIGSTQLATGAITAVKFSAGAIDSAAIASGALSTDEITAGVFTKIWAESTRSLTSLGVALTSTDFAANALSTTIIAQGVFDKLADSVWDEPTAAHTTAATFGQSAQIVLEGAASSGTSANNILLTGASTQDDLYNDAKVRIVSGPGIGQTRLISDYTGGTTLNATVVPDWTVTPTSASRFIIEWDARKGIQTWRGSTLNDPVTGRVDVTVGAMQVGVVTSTSVAAGAIGSTQIATDAINATKIASGALSTDEITAGVFTKIWSESTRTLTALGFVLGAADLAANTIGSTQIASAALTVAKFAASALTTGILDAGVFAKIAADVNIEVLDVLTVDTFGESTGAPASAATLERKWAWLETLARNEIWQTSTSQFLRGDTGNAVASAAVSLSTTVVSGSTAVVRGEFA